MKSSRLALTAMFLFAIVLAGESSRAANPLSDFIFLTTPSNDQTVVGKQVNPGQTFIGTGAPYTTAASYTQAEIKQERGQDLSFATTLQKLGSLSIDNQGIRFSDLAPTGLQVLTIKALPMSASSPPFNGETIVVGALTVTSLSASACIYDVTQASAAGNVGLPIPGVSPGPAVQASAVPLPAVSASPVPACNASPPPGTSVTAPGLRLVSVAGSGGVGNRYQFNVTAGALVLGVKAYVFNNIGANVTYNATFQRNDISRAAPFTQNGCGVGCHGNTSYKASIRSLTAAEMTSYGMGSGDAYCVLVTVRDTSEPGVQGSFPYCPDPSQIQPAAPASYSPTQHTDIQDISVLAYPSKTDWIYATASWPTALPNPQSIVFQYASNAPRLEWTTLQLTLSTNQFQTALANSL